MTVAAKRTRKRAIRGPVRGAVRHRAHDDAYHGARGEELALNITGTSTANVYLQARISPGHVRILADDLASTWAMTNNDANELTQIANSAQGSTITYTYDAMGRTTEKALGGKAAEYAWRYDSKLHTVTSDFPDEGNVSYGYGADGKRRSRTANSVTTGYNWDAGWNVINEETGAGALAMSYVHNPHRPGRATLAQIAGNNPASGTSHYFTHDHLGSTRSLFDASKDPAASYDYTPYGEAYTAASSFTTHRYTGHDWDPASRMHFAPYRYLNPITGSWLSRDPLGMVDGANLSSYVNGNPVLWNDPTGGFMVGSLPSINLDFRHERSCTPSEAAKANDICLKRCIAQGNWPTSTTCKIKFVRIPVIIWRGWNPEWRWTRTWISVGCTCTRPLECDPFAWWFQPLL